MDEKDLLEIDKTESRIIAKELSGQIIPVICIWCREEGCPDCGGIGNYDLQY